MKKLLFVLIALLTFTLVACDTVTTQEVDIVEVPVIIKEIEIVTIEVPVVVKEYDIVTVEIPVVFYEDTITKNVFFTADTDLAIITYGKGDTTYTLEMAYVDTLIDPPMVYFIQIEKQVNGIVEDWFFFEDYTGAELYQEFSIEVVDEDEFVSLMIEITTQDDNQTFVMLEEMYQELYDNYYE